MPWGKVDDRLYSSPKWMNVTKGGRALWVSALSWCMAQLTDGAVPKKMCAMLGGNTSDARSLVENGLWEITPTGYQFHDWLEYQPSRAQVLGEKESARQRQQKARDKAKASRNSHGVTEGVTHGVSSDIVTGAVTVPPSPPHKEEVEEEKPSSRKHPLRDDWEPTLNHHKKARDEGLDVNDEASKFRDYHLSKGSKYANWDSAFNNWLRKAVEFRGPQEVDLWSRKGKF